MKNCPGCKQVYFRDSLRQGILGYSLATIQAIISRQLPKIPFSCAIRAFLNKLCENIIMFFGALPPTSLFIIFLLLLFLASPVVFPIQQRNNKEHSQSCPLFARRLCPQHELGYGQFAPSDSPLIIFKKPFCVALEFLALRPQNQNFSAQGTEQITLARHLISHSKLRKFNFKSQEVNEVHGNYSLSEKCWPLDLPSERCFFEIDPYGDDFCTGWSDNEDDKKCAADIKIVRKSNSNISTIGYITEEIEKKILQHRGCP
uniref:Uncharacterized protein n=1 Tax=Romanomermis culicivorax TaxID=13658 RepID=A0A915JIU6_ROMCU